MPSRLIAIGDIHGCSAALDGLLERIEPGPDDTVVTLGDYIDRGPDSRGVIERLIALQDRCRLVPILGNHDETLLAVRAGMQPLEWFLEIGGIATLESYGPGLDPALVPEEHYRFLENCLDFFETDTHIFVHGNYEPDLPMTDLESGQLRWESLREYQPGPHVSGKTVIVGHTSQKTGEILDLGHLVCIDTFCYGGGWLTALEVTTGRVWQVDRRGNPRPDV